MVCSVLKTKLLYLSDYNKRARARRAPTISGSSTGGRIVRAVVAQQDIQGCLPRPMGHSAVRVVLSYNVRTPGKRGGRS